MGKPIKSLQRPYSLRRQVLQRERFVFISFVMWKENSAEEFSLRKSPHRCTLNYCHENCCLDLELLWFHCLYSTVKMFEAVQHQLKTCTCQYRRWYRAFPPLMLRASPHLPPIRAPTFNEMSISDACYSCPIPDVHPMGKGLQAHFVVDINVPFCFPGN